MKRLLAIVEQQKAGDQAHDTMFSFFENCWHLKDHVKNDPAVPQHVRQSIEDDVAHYEALKIAADIANRSKHLHLRNPPRLDAKVTAYHIKAYEGSDQDASASYDITLGNGSVKDAVTVARQAVADWEALFGRYAI
ncbi:MAG TPA: hypothetical protein VK573_06745 [Gemmatimonadales bacterium]|nr:hypothetical protein [Gemmatimonadales bacterium]